MQVNQEIRASALLMHGGLGAFMGLVTASLLLAIDAFGFGSMMQRVEQPATHLLLLVIKPAMLFGLIGIGWSMMRQLSGRQTVSPLD